MSHVQDEFKGRIERDVARIMRHLVGSEMNPGELDGEIVLTIADGQLKWVRFGPLKPEEETPALDEQGLPVATKKRKAKATDEPKADE